MAKSQNSYYQGLIPTINIQKNIHPRASINTSFYGIYGQYNKQSSHLRKGFFVIQTFAQCQINYKLKDATTLSLGYTNQINYPKLINQTLEHRVWQQIIFNFKKKNWLNYNRIRIEERFIKNKTQKRSQYSTRFRYQLGLKYTPLKNTNKGIYWNSYIEICYSTAQFKDFRNSESWGYFGIGYKANQRNKIEVAYINLNIFKPSSTLHLNLFHLLWSHNIN